MRKLIVYYDVMIKEVVEPRVVEVVIPKHLNEVGVIEEVTAIIRNDELRENETFHRIDAIE